MNVQHLISFLKNKTHIIWDWNGTILNDVDVCVDVLHALLQKYELPLVTKDFYLNYCSFPMVEFYKTLGFDLQKYCFSTISDDFMNLYFKKLYSESIIYPDVLACLNILKLKNIDMYVLSAACETSLKEQISYFKLNEYFKFIYGVEDHLAHGKLHRGKELLNNLPSVDKSKVLLIGDTDHDFEVGYKLGIDVLLTADGHQSLARLKSLNNKCTVLNSKIELRLAIENAFL